MFKEKVRASYKIQEAVDDLDVTETPAFLKWFGQSKVVDSKGKPLVVYHGTRATFDVFKPSTQKGNQGEQDQLEGIYFTDAINGAKFYALTDDVDDDRYLKKVYLSIKKPYMADNYNELKKDFKDASYSQISKEIKRKGYDGIFVKKGFYSNGGPHKLFLAFYPNQIKSVHAKEFNIESDSIHK